MSSWISKIGFKFKQFAIWLKGKWKILGVFFLFAIGIPIAWLFSRKKANVMELFLQELKKQQEQTQRDLEELRKIQQEQIQKQQEINQKYHEVIAKIERDYQNKLQLLSAEKEQELKKIIENFQNNPITMAEEINKLFGIPLYFIPGPPV